MELDSFAFDFIMPKHYQKRSWLEGFLPHHGQW